MMSAAAPVRLVKFAQLSVAAAVATFLLKLAAWHVTGSVGMLSDALESLANLAAALVAVATLSVAGRPDDEEHAFGHGKAEYFSSGFEGLLILGAAAGIGWTAVARLFDAKPLEQPFIGVAAAVAASVINLAVAAVLRRAGHRHGSPALQADAHHLMTDVWTSAAVIVSVVLIAFTGWNWLDPVIGILLCFHITVSGVKLVWSSAQGLMDASLPEQEIAQVRAVLDSRAAAGVTWHALRTRRAGTHRFVAVHLLVPGAWSVAEAHRIADEIEGEIADRMTPVTVFTHIEPAEDPASMDDVGLIRKPSGKAKTEPVPRLDGKID